jgi:lysophospholipase L1-like esterase
MELGVWPLSRAQRGRRECLAAAALSAALFGCAAEAAPEAKAPIAVVTFSDTREAAVEEPAADEGDSDDTGGASADRSESGTDAADDLEFMEPQTLSEHMTVLHIGDSFAGALGVSLNRELEQRGAKGILEFKTSTFITTWAHDPRLKGFLRAHDPDLVLISLGANEVDSRRPERRARLIRHLVSKLKGRPCVWIAPPLWEGARPDLLRVIERNCAPCAYLDTNQLVPDLERMPDKIHPTADARKRWAKAVAAWLEDPPPGQSDQRWVKWSPRAKN